MNTITRNELKELLDDGEKVVLIDVSPAEFYQAAHLPGARNCCVYDVTFLDQAVAAVPDKAAPVVVYGSSTHSLASSTAAEKLERAGYTAVRDYRGGLLDWETAGLAIQRDAALPALESPRHGRHEIDTARSRVLWTGRNVNGSHNGSLAVKAGWIDVAAAAAASGEITLDMDSIADFDLADPALNRLLVAHLKSDDFFDTARFPVAVFHLKHVTLNSHARPGSVNADITGALTMKGVTHDLGFPALIEVLPGGALSAEAHFDIDRTRWNVLYGSGRFFEWLGRHLVHDCISLSLHLFTR